MKKEYYLDNAATTKVSNEVMKEVERVMNKNYGNASSMHELGEKALEEMNKARMKIAKEINAKPQEVLFTSGGTESNNLAIQGLAKRMENKKKKKIVISAIEHPSVSEVCNYLSKWGYEIIKIKVNGEGLVDLNEFNKILNNYSKEILLVSVMHVNNVIGTVQDIEQIGRICKEKEVLFHTDAVQSFGKLNIDVRKMNIDLLSASGHKIGAPKGIGFLYVKEGVKIEPLIFGGGQERGLRSGTENVAGIVGFAKAVEVQKKIKKEKVKNVGDLLINRLEEIGGRINGSKGERIYNNIHVFFEGIENSTLVTFLSQKGIYVSAGSACDSKKEKEDEVLKAIGLSKNEQEGSIRITINENIEEIDVDSIVKEIEKTVKLLKDK